MVVSEIALPVCRNGRIFLGSLAAEYLTGEQVGRNYYYDVHIGVLIQHGGLELCFWPYLPSSGSKLAFTQIGGAWVCPFGRHLDGAGWHVRKYKYCYYW